MKKLVSSISYLASFDLFVLVISMLEQYSDHEATALLNCSGQEIKAARVRAVQDIVVAVTHGCAIAGEVNMKERLASVLRWPLQPQRFHAREFVGGEA